jgi:DNA polymerase III epsilon subunit-like protein
MPSQETLLEEILERSSENPSQTNSLMAPEPFDQATDLIELKDIYEQAKDRCVFNTIPPKYREKILAAQINLQQVVTLSKDLIFLDTETTGLEDTDEIISLAAVKFACNGKISMLKFTCEPTIPIHAAATAIHGITKEQLQDKAPYWHYIPAIQQFICGCDIIGFNLSFDFKKMDRHLNTWIDVYQEAKPIRFKRYTNHIVGDVIDLALIFWKKFPKVQQRKTMSQAHKIYTGKRITNAHSALGDVIACAQMLPHMIQMHTQQANQPWYEFVWWYTMEIQLGPWFEALEGPENPPVLWISQSRLMQHSSTFWHGHSVGIPPYWMIRLSPKGTFGEHPYKITEYNARDLKTNQELFIASKLDRKHTIRKGISTDTVVILIEIRKQAVIPGEDKRLDGCRWGIHWPQSDLSYRFK